MALFQFQVNLGPEDEEFTVSVDSVRLGRPGKYDGPWEDSYPDEDDEVEYEILGADGREYTEATDREHDNITEKVIQIFKDSKEDYRDYSDYE